MRIADMFQIQTVTGVPIQTAGITVTPQSQTLIVHLPFGGLVWHRPTAILVERAGRTVRIPIVDVTRAIQVALFGATAFMFSIMIRSRRRKE